jgi:polar amino acid transport system substrate-binding protein
MSRLKAGLAVLAIIGLATIFASGPAIADGSTLDTVRARGTLIVGIKTDYPPYGYIDADGNPAGFDIELAKYIAAKLGVKVELRPVTSGNRIAMLQSGTVDVLAASLSITRSRAKAIDFSIPYIGIGGVFVVRKDSDVKGYPDLAGKTVAVVQGTPSIIVLRHEQPAAHVLTFQEKPQAVQAVLEGKADAFIEDAGPAHVFATEHPELKTVGVSFDPQTIALGLRQNDSQFRNAVNFAIVDMAEEGVYLKLYRQYFGSDPDPTFRIWPWPP